MDQTDSDFWQEIDAPEGSDGYSESIPQIHINALHHVQPFDAQFGAWPKKYTPVQLNDYLFGALTGDQSICPKTYAILDSAKVLGLAERIAASGLEFRSLFKGATAEELESVAPYLVTLNARHDLTRQLFTRAGQPSDLWDAAPGIFIRSDLTFHDIWRHFRKFTRVQDDNGKWYYFRFWEPQWIAATLTEMPPSDVVRFMAGIQLIIATCPDGTVDLIHLPGKGHQNSPFHEINS